jgi:hypothetical protein
MRRFRSNGSGRTQLSRFITMIAATISHLYRVGEMVILDSHAGYFSKSDGAFTVLAQLPPLGTDLQYRIKSIAEPYQRVVLEHQLARALPRDGLVTGISPWGVAPD